MQDQPSVSPGRCLDIEVRDHRLTFMPDAVRPEQQTPYRLTLDVAEGGQALYLRMQHPEREDFGLEAIIEVHEGVPCLRLSNAVGGDMLLHLFATPEGVGIIPDRADARPQNLSSKPFYPHMPDFSNTQLYRNELEPEQRAAG